MSCVMSYQIIFSKYIRTDLRHQKYKNQIHSIINSFNIIKENIWLVFILYIKNMIYILVKIFLTYFETIQ